MARVVQTTWLDADDYASVVVVEDVDAPREVVFDGDRSRALQLLAHGSRQRRRRSPTPVRGQLTLLRLR